MKTTIIVPSENAWEFGIQTVFSGGKREIARREIEPGIGIEIGIEGFEENSENDIGFGIFVDHIGMRYEDRNIWWEYAHDKTQCEEIVNGIYRAFLGEEIGEPWNGGF